jgi:hypothetical protein
VRCFTGQSFHWSKLCHMTEKDTTDWSTLYHMTGKILLIGCLSENIQVRRIITGRCSTEQSFHWSKLCHMTEKDTTDWSTLYHMTEKDTTDWLPK